MLKIPHSIRHKNKNLFKAGVNFKNIFFFVFIKNYNIKAKNIVLIFIVYNLFIIQNKNKIVNRNYFCESNCYSLNYYFISKNMLDETQK